MRQKYDRTEVFQARNPSSKENGALKRDRDGHCTYIYFDCHPTMFSMSFKVGHSQTFTEKRSQNQKTKGNSKRKPIVYVRLRRCTSHTPRVVFQPRPLLDNQEGANAERCIFGKLSARCFQRRHFWHRHTFPTVEISIAENCPRGGWCYIHRRIQYTCKIVFSRLESKNT